MLFYLALSFYLRPFPSISLTSLFSLPLSPNLLLCKFPFNKTKGSEILMELKNNVTLNSCPISQGFGSCTTEPRCHHQIFRRTSYYTVRKWGKRNFYLLCTIVDHDFIPGRGNNFSNRAVIIIIRTYNMS